MAWDLRCTARRALRSAAAPFTGATSHSVLPQSPIALSGSRWRGTVPVRVTAASAERAWRRNIEDWSRKGPVRPRESALRLRRTWVHHLSVVGALSRFGPVGSTPRWVGSSGFKTEGWLRPTGRTSVVAAPHHGRRISDPTPSPGDRCPGFVAQPRRWWAFVHRQAEATQCTETRAWTGRRLSPSGDRWRVREPPRTPRRLDGVERVRPPARSRFGGFGSGPRGSAWSSWSERKPTAQTDAASLRMASITTSGFESMAT